MMIYYTSCIIMKNISDNLNFGNFNFYSSGSNDLKDTNKIKSSIINDLSFESKNFTSNYGIVNNLNIFLKIQTLLEKMTQTINQALKFN